MTDSGFIDKAKREIQDLLLKTARGHRPEKYLFS